MTKACLRCHRPLRDPVWAARGLGRVCARRLGLVAVRPSAPLVVARIRVGPVETGDGQLELFELQQVTL